MDPDRPSGRRAAQPSGAPARLHGGRAESRRVAGTPASSDQPIPAEPPIGPAPAGVSDASEEAQALVNDALEQSALIIANAERSTEAMLPRPARTLSGELADSRATAGVLREQAEAIVAAPGGGSEEIEVQHGERQR